MKGVFHSLSIMNFIMKNNFKQIIFLTLLAICKSVSDHENPIYINHYFARQLFKYFNESYISIQCKTVANYVRNHEYEDWALRLVDSSGTIPSGLAKGNFQFMGDFDECLDIEVSLKDNERYKNLNSFHGQYCSLDLPIELVFYGKQFSSMNISGLPLNPSLGVCLPSACSQQDLNQILQTYSNKTGFKVTASHCTDSKSYEMHLYYILILSGFSIIIILITIGTILEIRHIFHPIAITTKLKQLLMSFSLYENTVKLFKTDNQKETIACFHGFRLISLLFIIIYHIYTEAQIPSANLFEILESEKSFILQIVTNAGLWVEAFLLLSGFLSAYSLIREVRRTSIKNYNPITNIIHRYLRLTPSLIGIIAFSIIQEIMTSGPQWFKYVDISEQTCHKNWWTNLLYINNIVRLNQLGPPSECLSFTWYLAVDMQLFLISPLLILLLASNDLKKQYFGIAINVCVIIISCIITAVITINNGLTPTVLMTVYDLDYINKVYKQSYCRIGPYCIGILMAYYYLKYKGNIYIKPNKNIILWLLSIIINISITFLTWPWLLGQSYNNFLSVLYGATHRTLWSLSCAYILFACATGHGGVINKILSFNGFTPFSRLSFQAYLYHSVLISRFVYEARQPIYSSILNLIMMFFQYTFLTFVVSYLAFLMFEIPFSNIERIFLRRIAPKNDKIEETILNNNIIPNNSYDNYGSSGGSIQNIPQN